MDIYLAVTLALEESAPVFIAGIIYYIIARVALMQWWMRDQLDEKARAKGRSWLMSLALSGYLSVAGVYYLYFCASILATGTTFIDFPVDHASSWGSALDTRACACVMLALTTLDLAIGSIDYRQQVGILTGWVHHTVYVGLCVYILYTRQTFVLMVFSFCEIPTLMLAVGSLYRPWRTDVAFGVVFFVTRILITTGLFLLVQIHDPVPFHRGAAVGILPLHYFWFAEWVVSYRRRNRTASSGVDDAAKASAITSESEGRSEAKKTA